MASVTIVGLTFDGNEVDFGNEERDFVHVTDKGGNSALYQRYHGVLVGPVYKPSFLGKAESLLLKSDDIYLSAYPRTGTHWTFEMTCMLVAGNTETVRGSKLTRQLELIAGDDLSYVPSPRVFNTHLHLSHASSDLKKKKCKIIYNLRDPKDVAVSLYNNVIDFEQLYKYSGLFEDYLYMFLKGEVENNGIFEHWRDAERYFDDNPDIPVHFQIYEDTIKDPVASVQKLSDFLGLPRNDDLCRAIANKCQFDKMKTDKNEFAVKVGDRNVLYRKGIVGDWKNYFTDGMLEDYYRAYDDKMAGSRFYHRYARQK